MRALFVLAITDDRYTHLVFVPLIAVGLLYWDRRRIFGPPERAAASAALLAAALLAALAAIPCALWFSGPASNDRLWLPSLAVGLIWTAVFVLLNGTAAARAASFPLGFLVLAIPLPSTVLNAFVSFLQSSSAEVAHAIFRIIRVPVFRDGFRFSLPGVDIEVARECAGIRSTMALLLCGAVAAHLFLHGAWRKFLFIMLAVPVAIFKNAVRIVSLSWLAIYVNRWFLNGPLHHQGGPLFAMIGLAIMFPLLLLLQRWDNPKGQDVRKLFPAG